VTLTPGNNPFSIFPGLDGRPLNNGHVYIGIAGQDPETNPQPIFWDDQGNVPAPNPMTTQVGYIWNAGTPARFWVQNNSYSIRVLDSLGRQVFYEKNVTFELPAGIVTASSLTSDPDALAAITAKLVYSPSGSGAPYTPVQDALKNAVINGLYPPASGGTDNRGVEISFDTAKASLRYGGSDLTPQDDARNFWRGLTSKNAWGDPANVGLYSVSFNRNGCSYGPYSTTFGHDCIVYSTAGIAGGAGSCVGDPDDILSGDKGYCSVAIGKNVQAAGAKSAAFCEESQTTGRAAFAAGYFALALNDSDDGIGAVALGREVTALGAHTGALGAWLSASGGAYLIGAGINPGTRMTKSTAGVGLGVNVSAPTLDVAGGSGTLTDFGYVVVRGGRQDYVLDGGTLPASQATQAISNPGSGGYGDYHIRPRVAGALANGWIVDAGRTSGVVSLYPATDNAMNLGGPTNRPAQLFAATASINTSDANDKWGDRDLSAEELAVARRIQIKAYKSRDAIALKGEEAARWHFGVIAQEVKAAFEAEGLDGFEYGLLCYDEWDEIPEVRDESGALITSHRPAGSRYGIRYPELLCFIAKADRQRMDALEQRLAALEAAA